jgi:poly [ADP-ribose] polymerase
VYVDYGRVGKTSTKQEYLTPDGKALTESEARAFYAEQAISKFWKVVCSQCNSKTNKPGAEKCACGRTLNYKDYPKQKYIPVQLAQTKVGSQEAQAQVDTSKLSAKAQANVTVTASPGQPAQAVTYHPFVKDLLDHIYEEAGHAARSKLNTGTLKATADNPLGTLSQSQLDTGKEILTEVADVLAKKPGDRHLRSLTSRWYTTIPQAIGMQPDWDSLCLNDWTKYQAALDLLDLLGDVKGVQASFAHDTSTHDRYTAIGATIRSMDTAEPKYRQIVDYIRNTQSHHHRVNLKVRRIFEIGVKGQENGWLDPDRVGNVKELFHGSRNANIVGIMTKGLLMRPPGVVITGSMFGNGLYFADQSTKSTQYSMGGWGGTQNRRNNAYLFLADVALGRVMKYQNAQSHLTTPPRGYHSVQGEKGSSLLHNEFIIYSLRQHRLRYLVDFTT